MNVWQTTFLGLQQIPRELTAFEIEAFFTFTATEAESDHPTPASSPCMPHELGPDGAPRVDSQQATDVARWRKAERERLISTRIALTGEIRAAQTLAIAQDLDSLLASAHAPLISAYWPI